MLISALSTLFQVADLVEDHDPALAQVAGDEGTHGVARGVLVSHRTGQQVLKTVGAIVPYRLSQRPAVPGHPRDQQRSSLTSDRPPPAVQTRSRRHRNMVAGATGSRSPPWRGRGITASSAANNARSAQVSLGNLQRSV